MFASYQRRAELRGSTESLLDTNLPEAKEEDAQDEASGNKRVRDLPSFSSTEVSVSDILADRKTLANMETSRRELSSASKRRLIQASLMDYGFPTMESLDLELLSDANMGFEDVVIGTPVMREMIPAVRGYQAGDDATPEQKKAMEKWMDYGFDSLEDFNKLEEAQETLRNLNLR